MLDGKYPDQFLISLDYEQVEFVIRKELTTVLKSLQFRSGPPPFFSYDEEVEQEGLKRYRAAFETVLEYYGGAVNANTGDS
jgi:hypothetical protein